MNDDVDEPNKYQPKNGEKNKKDDEFDVQKFMQSAVKKKLESGEYELGPDIEYKLRELGMIRKRRPSLAERLNAAEREYNTSTRLMLKKEASAALRAARQEALMQARMRRTRQVVQRSQDQSYTPPQPFWKSGAAPAPAWVNNHPIGLLNNQNPYALAAVERGGMNPMLVSSFNPFQRGPAPVPQRILSENLSGSNPNPNPLGAGLKREGVNVFGVGKKNGKNVFGLK